MSRNSLCIVGHPGLPNNIGNTRWWTKERVLAGLRKAMKEIKGPLPCRDAKYSRIKNGRYDWPTPGRVLEYFGSMARGWLAAGAPRNRVSLLNIDWTDEDREDLLTFAGVETLEKIGRRLRRSYGSVKRQLYSIGVTARANQGLFSAAELSKHYQCSYRRVQKLLTGGILKGEYDEERHRWQVDLESITPAAEALLRAPKRTHKTFPTDMGDYYQRHGIKRVLKSSVVRSEG